MSFSHLEQSVMFMCGANSIFTGDKLLTTANPEFDEDTRGDGVPLLLNLTDYELGQLLTGASSACAPTRLQGIASRYA